MFAICIKEKIANFQHINMVVQKNTSHRHAMTFFHMCPTPICHHHPPTYSNGTPPPCHLSRQWQRGCTSLYQKQNSMNVSGSPKRWYVAYTPPEGNIWVVYKWYILPIGGLYAIYHLLGEPEATIEKRSQVAQKTNGIQWSQFHYNPQYSLGRFLSPKLTQPTRFFFRCSFFFEESVGYEMV